MLVCRAPRIMHSLLIALALALWTCPATAQGSFRRDRPQPSEAAARAGHAIAWRTDLEAALEEARASGKPVFWYVPTISGSPMDRRDLIDHYAMAGPFSWPRVVALLEERTIPLRLKPSRRISRERGLQRIEFIEPGLLLLDPEGEELARLDELTTFHPSWFMAFLEIHLGAVEPAPASSPHPGFLDPDVGQRFLHELPRAEGPLDLEAETAGLGAADRAEALWLLGAGLHRCRREAEADRVWAQLAASAPDHPLAAKAAMEREGLGPFVRGFETYCPPEPAAWEFGEHGTRARPGAFTEEELWERGVGFLLAMQREGGGFEDSQYDFGGADSLPNVYAAVTALAGTALLERAARHPEEAAVEAALLAARRCAVDPARVNPEDSDEIVWAHLYRLRFLCRWLELRPDDAGELRPAIAACGEQLVSLQEEDGSWFHEYSNPFITASCLLALADARDLEIAIPGGEKAALLGMDALLRCRAEDGSYTYYDVSGGRAQAELEEGVGRIPLGELALRRFGSREARELERAIAVSFEHERWLLEVRKYDDHASRFVYGGFFFWYDLIARTEAIAALSDPAARAAFAKRQREQILSLPELDGCFVDSHELGRCYGTASALICLARLPE